ncbi:MAG TPA: hypothetical protein PKO23_19080, partial [Candidatus Hydrogenedentes bacterium]|nr:hypothetical protein [Candidatus Hydrogenedentota bacterium]
MALAFGAPSRQFHRIVNEIISAKLPDNDVRLYPVKPFLQDEIFLEGAVPLRPVGEHIQVEMRLTPFLDHGPPNLRWESV